MSEKITSPVSGEASTAVVYDENSLISELEISKSNDDVSEKAGSLLPVELYKMRIDIIKAIAEEVHNATETQITANRMFIARTSLARLQQTYELLNEKNNEKKKP